MRFLEAVLVLLSFGSCWSLNDDGVASLKCKERLAKDPLLAWRDGGGRVDPCCVEEVADLRGAGHHRKVLGKFFNPYKGSIKNHPAAAVTSPTSASSSMRKSNGFSTPPVPGKKPRRKDVSAPPPYVPSATSFNQKKSSRSSSKTRVAIVAGCIGGSVFLLLLVMGVLIFRRQAGKSVNPWRTGLSGQLQKAFITGVPKVKRPEIEAACEDFSNVIGSCSIGTLFKGTLSSAVEIAVASVDATFAKDWNDNLELQFRKKIETLSKINHKNFLNLLGYCGEDVPFTRIIVFEYAPNGTLFEHLHDKESEQLDWGTRLKIAMGIAYCLDHMHQLNPPITHNNLVSSSILLSEDYSAKVADFSFGNQKCPSEKESCTKTLIGTHVSVTTPEDNVHSFGELLFEMMTCRVPDSNDNNSNSADHATESFDEKIEKIGEVIKSSIQANPKQRPTMREVTTRLREITGISPEEAIPKLSPLWWAELEVLSAV